MQRVRRARCVGIRSFFFSWYVSFRIISVRNDSISHKKRDDATAIPSPSEAINPVLGAAANRFRFENFSKAPPCKRFKSVSTNWQRKSVYEPRGSIRFRRTRNRSAARPLYSACTPVTRLKRIARRTRRTNWLRATVPNTDRRGSRGGSELTVDAISNLFE